MKEIFEKMWELALPYLKQGVRKDFVLHTKGVVKAMEMLLEKEEGDEDILMPAAILHDVGWAKVPIELQRSDDETDKDKALRLHIEYAAPIAEEILAKVGCDKENIKKIIDIILAHKFQDPEEHSKRLLIDADTLSDAFEEAFYSDAKAYGKSPEELYEFRKRNRFYLNTSKEIFDRELEERKKEFQTLSK